MLIPIFVTRFVCIVYRYCCMYYIVLSLYHTNTGYIVYNVISDIIDVNIVLVNVTDND